MRRRILNSILDLTGSQCSEANTGEMWSLFLVLVRTLLEPDNKELQESNLDVTKAWTRFSAS